jgi:hypothetical protein
MPPTIAGMRRARPRPRVSPGFSDRLDWEGFRTERGDGVHDGRGHGKQLETQRYSTKRQSLARVEGVGDVVAKHGDNPEYALEWIAPIARTLHEFRALGENWDSYGGSPIQPVNIAEAVAFLWGIVDSGVRLPHPSIQPSSDGGVGLSWLSGDTEVEIAFESDEDSGIVITEGGHTWDAPISEAAGILTDLADRL